MLQGIRRQVVNSIPEAIPSTDTNGDDLQGIADIHIVDAQLLKQMEIDHAKDDLIFKDNLSPRATEQGQTTTKMVTRRRPPRKCTPSQKQDKSLNI